MQTAGQSEGDAGNGLAIRAVGMSKDFGSIVAVKDVDLNVSRGVLYGLVGPNGSGKTTLVRMLVGLLRPTRGSAEVLGERVPARGAVGRLGYMPQETAIYLDLTLMDNLELFASLYGVTKADFRDRIDGLLDMVDLTERRHDVVANFSGGMKHRASLACALIHDPELLFLDEPTVGVDPELRVGFWGFFDRLKRQRKTVIMTTHYLDEAMRCDVVGMMRAGEIIAEGPPGALIAKAGASSLEEAFLRLTRRAES